MKLIDADRLLTDRMKSKYYHLPNGDTAIPIIDIEDAPTIDAVEVVRCKDCKWSDWYMTLNGEHRCYCMEHGSLGHTDDDFCSYGEREDGE